jgi:hypothetical protein
MHPALANLVKIGQLKTEPTSRDELAGYLNHAAQCLKDAAVPEISASGRFEFAYTAAHALALAALRANGVRTDRGPAIVPSCSNRSPTPSTRPKTCGPC